MEEKFQIAGRALPAVVSLGLMLAITGGCSSEGSSFGTGGMGNPGSSGSGQTSGGSTGMTTQAMGGSGNDAGSTGTTGGDGNTGGSSNPTGGSAGSGAGGEGLLGGSGGTGPQEEPCPKPVTAEDPNPICHEFYANDNARNQINYVNEFDPTKNWTKPVNDTTVNSPRQAELVDNPMATNGKAVLISVNKGYQEYDAVSGERLVNVVLAGTTGVRGAVRLPNGNTLLGVGDDKLRIVDKNGTTVGTECTLPGNGADSLRVVQRNAETGHLLLGRLLDLYVVNEQCQQQWTAKLPAGSKAYSVFPRLGGGVWATTGAPSTVVEINDAGQIVSQVGGKGQGEHPGIGLDFFSGFERLPNGNIVAANWQGHVNAPAEDTPHLVEFTPDNKLVWRWGNQTLARQITNTLIIR